MGSCSPSVLGSMLTKGSKASYLVSKQPSPTNMLDTELADPFTSTVVPMTKVMDRNLRACGFFDGPTFTPLNEMGCAFTGW